jgi:superkiller protein 3
MNKIFQATLALGLLASPSFADKKLDDAVAKAEEQLQKGKPEEALKSLQKAVTSSPSSEGFIALARLQERLGAFDDAAQSASRAVDLAAGAGAAAKADAQAYQSGLTLLVGTGKDALGLAQQAVAGQATPAALAAQARAQVRVQDPLAALQSADKAVQAGVNSALAHEARGDALLALKRADDSVAAYRKALELDPKLNRARIGLAAALTAAGKGAEAQAEAKKATEADPKSAEAFATLGLAILAQSLGPDGAVTNQAKWSEAIAEAQQGAFLNAKSIVAQVAVGRMFEAAGNLDQAAAAYERASQIEPGLLALRIKALNWKYPPHQFQQRFKEAKEKSPDGGPAVGKALLARDPGFQEAKKLAEQFPSSGEAQLEVGKYLFRTEDYRGAAEYFKKAMQHAPGLAEAFAFAGTSHQYAGHTPEALAAYQRAVELDPKSMIYRSTYGLLLGISGEYEKAAAELQKVVSSPGYKDAAGWANLGWAYRSMTPKKTSESVAAYKKALELDPKEEQAALGMGWAYSYANAYDDAIAAFQKAVQINPGVAAEAYNGIAWSHFFKKDMAAAKSFLDKAGAAGRADARLAENIEKLEKLAAQREAYEQYLREAEKAREQGGDVGTLSRQARTGETAARIRAVRELGGLGAQAVPGLIGALDDENPLPVREAAVAALGSMGPGAKQSLPYLMDILNTREEKTVMSKEEMQAMMKFEDFKKRVREAVVRIQK